jgi:hypothetical protein
MRDISEVLRAKEERILQLRSEIEALRVVAPMLANGNDQQPATSGKNSIELAPYLTELNS